MKRLLVIRGKEGKQAQYYEISTDGLDSDGSLLEKITKSLGISIAPHIMRSKDPRALMTTIFAAWLPLSTAVLVSVIERLPSPKEAQATRLPELLNTSPGSQSISTTIRNAMINFNTSKEAPVVAYVSKMVSVPVSELPQNKRKAGSSLSPEEARELARKKRAEIAKVRAEANDESTTTDSLDSAFANASLANSRPEIEQHSEAEAEQLIGFARLYSGTLSVGDSVYVLPPKFSPESPHAAPEPKKVTVTALYLLMGRSLEALSSVPAGVVFGIGGLEGHILKTGTLCSQLEGGVNLAGVSMGGEPIVRIALEPVNPADLDKLKKGLRLLEQSDPCARFEVQENGEYVIFGAGELHLERCIKDLRERFARCEIQAGEPIVPYRETIVSAAEMAPPKQKDMPRGSVATTTSSKQIHIRLRIRPLPSGISDTLEKRVDDIRQLYAKQRAQEKLRNIGKTENQDVEDEEAEGILNDTGASSTDLLNALKKALEEVHDERDFWLKSFEHIAAFGPRRIGPNMLIDLTPTGICRKLYVHLTDRRVISNQLIVCKMMLRHNLMPDRIRR